MPRLEEGQKFEHYRVVRRLGNGIAGESYEAEDTRIQRKVTLKLLHPWSTLPDAARRQFFREMQGISFITHPYMAATLDYGEVDGQLYIARRYVGPGSLLGNEGRSWFRPPLNVASAIRFTHQLAQALYQLHNYGYLHGSLTLSNILVLRSRALDDETEFAPFLLSDAGTAHFVCRFGHPQIKFLPITAAPEQIRKRATAASDQYALAVILYFWLAGSLPFLGAPEEIERAKLAETFTPLSSLNSKVTSEQEKVLRQALSASPERRYPSIIAFAEALLASLSRPASPLQEEPVSILVLTKVIAEQQPSLPKQPEPAPEPQRGPIPQTVPDVPLPIPDPEPTPIPQPEPPLPRPEPEPKPAPEPRPEIVPPPAPDIPLPMPEPVPASPDEPAKETESQPTGLEAEQIISASLIITSPYTEQAREVILEREKTTI
ncbi:MAG: serine/threonine protein kinase, partial [Chloroflexi bacterium]|nr:serine/threonine protein kinase [Chloroflexota bacterium]